MMAFINKEILISVSSLLVLHLALVFCNEEGALRLADGFFDYQGVVQIFHGDDQPSWGLICDKGWDFADAEVACRQLGYPGASLSAAPFNIERPTGDVHLKDVACRGDEERLTDCDHGDWGVSDPDCVTNNFARIQCRVANYMGCADVTSGSPVMTGKTVNDINLSVVSCIGSCRKDGFPIAGVQAPSTCVCGTYGEKVELTGGVQLEKCNASCPGDDHQICGGTNSMSIYDVELGSCGGKFSGKNISIISPGFPGKYPAGFTCRWEADVSANAYTTIRIPVLDLADNDELVISMAGSTDRLGFQDSYEEKVAVEVSKITVTFTSTTASVRGGGFMVTLTDDSYCPAVEVVNGSLVIDNNYMYRPDDAIEVECNKGYMPYEEMTTCTPDGSWRPEPKCVLYNKWNSWEFRRTVLLMAIVAVCVLFVMFMITICYIVWGDSKKKHDGRYYGINTDSGEAQGRDGEATPSKEEYKAVGMEDPGEIDMIDEEAREAVIPLASEVDV